MRKQLRALFSGTVQGVGFRYTTRRLAAQFNVVGFVRNLDNGRVELVAAGEENEVGAFLNEVKNKMSAYIRDTDLEWTEPEKKYERFEITY